LCSLGEGMTAWQAEKKEREQGFLRDNFLLLSFLYLSMRKKHEPGHLRGTGGGSRRPAREKKRWAFNTRRRSQAHVVLALKWEFPTNLGEKNFRSKQKLV